MKNKILLLKCKKLGGAGKMDKCTNTCCDKGTNTRDREEDQEVSWSQASGDGTVVEHATRNPRIGGLKAGRLADRQTGRQAD